MWDSRWWERGLCLKKDPEYFFIPGERQNNIKRECMGCPVRTECLADALDSGSEFGIWGGMTERERRALLRRRPNVSSWRDLLEAARDDGEVRIPLSA